MILESLTYIRKEGIRKYEGSDQRFTAFIYEIEYRISSRSRKTLTAEIRLVFSSASKKWYSKNSLQNIAEKMTKDWRVNHSGFVHIDRKIGNLLIDLGESLDFSTEVEAVDYYNNFYNKNGFDQISVKRSLERAIEKAF